MHDVIICSSNSP